MRRLPSVGEPADRAIASKLLAGGRAPRRTGAIVLLAVAATFGYWWHSEKAPSRWVDLSTPSGSLRVFAANDSAERSQGLSDRDDLPGDGMLLQWNAPGRHPIWMAGMRFPLDLIWLEQDGRVAGVITNVPICSIPTCPMYEPEGTRESIAVLELPSGRAASLDIKPGIMIRGLPR